MSYQDISFPFAYLKTISSPDYKVTAMKQSEEGFNSALAQVLRPCHNNWSISGEYLVTTTYGKRKPDILLISPNRIALMIETEFEPAYKVEEEARARLDLNIPDAGLSIEVVIALCYPQEWRSTQDPTKVLQETKILKWAVFSHDNRFPSEGWLIGGIDGLSRVIRRAIFLSQSVENTVDLFQQSVSYATRYLTQITANHPGIDSELAKILCVKSHGQIYEQTRKMATTMVINAFLFQERLTGHHGILAINQIKNQTLIHGKIDPNVVITEWQKILNINYWPIFDITIQILIALPTTYASHFLEDTIKVAQDLAASGLVRSHDLTGTVLQRLITERKFLATFYTMPAAAEFLACLALDPNQTPNHGSWQDEKAVTTSLVGDLACGTGTLLHATYERMLELHEDNGGNPENIHATMLEQSLIGCDVLPLATHLTVSMLAGIFPHVIFGGTQVYTLPFGRQSDDSVWLGALEMLGNESQIPIQFAHTPRLIQKHKGTAPSDHTFTTEVTDHSLDFVIMNPPYTRSTGHEGSTIGVPSPSLAGLGTTPADQRVMADKMETLTKQISAHEMDSYHGNAGLASAFVAIMARKLRPGGRVAMVMPLTVAQGPAWEKTRALFAHHFTNLQVISIAAATAPHNRRAFSADTSIAELLIVADKKVKNQNQTTGRWTNIILRQQLRSAIEGAELALTIRAAQQAIRKLEDPPYGGTVIKIGNTIMAELLSMPKSTINNTPWLATGILDLSLAQITWHLINGQLWLPRRSNSLALAITPLGMIADRGFGFRDINGVSGRGGFDIETPCSATASYPALWNHNAPRERCLLVEPDSEGRVRIGKEQQAARIWAKASRIHYNRNFGFASQSLAMCVTNKLTIGGRAWPNIIVHKPDQRWEEALALWSNSTLGMLLYWWQATRNQPGRGSITPTAILALPVLDLRTLSDRQLDSAQEAFSCLKSQPMRLINENPEDRVRDELDRWVIRDLLGLSQDDYLGVREIAHKLAAEPSIHGGKKSKACLDISLV